MPLPESGKCRDTGGMIYDKRGIYRACGIPERAAETGFSAADGIDMQHEGGNGDDENE